MSLTCQFRYFASRLVIGCLFIFSAAASDAKESIFLYKSPITEAFFGQNGASYETLLVRWRQYLNERHSGNYRLVSRSQLLDGLPSGVLILGSAVLLDDEERKAINSFAASGGSVIATWGTGARDGRGRWTGYEFLSSVFGVTIDGKIRRQDPDWFLNLYGDSIVTWSHPAGKRIFLGKTAELPLYFSSKNLSGVYLDWSRVPESEAAKGAIAFQELNGSRRVYFGFSESSWEYIAADEFQPMLDSTMDWLLHKPKSFLAAWPNGYLSAHLLEMDTEDQFQNAIHFANDLESVGVKGTFYSLTSISRKHADLVKRLAEKHEIGYHADVHFGFKGKSEEEQERRIKNMITQMNESVGNDLAGKISGFRAPTESYDATTDRVLRKNGIKHHVTELSATDARLPYFSTAEKSLEREKAIVGLPRTQADDLNYEALRYPANKVTANMLTELGMVMEMGGLGVVSVHSQNYGDGGSMAIAMPEYLNKLKSVRGKAWVTTGGEIAEWWRSRDRVKVRSSKSDSPELIFSVNPPGEVRGASFIVLHPNQGKSLISISPIGESINSVHKLIKIDELRTAVVFDNLKAGEYRFKLQF